MNFWTGTVSSNVLRLSLVEPSGGVGRSPNSPEDRSTLMALEDEAMPVRDRLANDRRFH
jgi:hypothetical protein